MMSRNRLQTNLLTTIVVATYLIPVMASIALLTLAGTAGAVTRSMVGSLHVENMSLPSGQFELTPGVYGKKIVGETKSFPPTDGVVSVEALGTTPATFVGRGVSIAGNQMNRTGLAFQPYTFLTNVAQLTKSFMTLQQAATFGENMGALAQCPGPGCTASGAGTLIQWCPPAVENEAISPSPGTVGAQVGNWDCTDWQAAGTGVAPHRISISNQSGRPNFGGTLDLLRNQAMNVWLIFQQPSTPNAPDAEVTRSFMDLQNVNWPGGVDNFEFHQLGNNPGPRLLAQIGGDGAVVDTFGCANGIGTNGGDYVLANPIVNAGSNCGTLATPRLPGDDWGFQLTTGTVSGSDPYPFGAVGTTVNGTPFHPSFATQPASRGFFFTRRGSDELTIGGKRNLVMVGGGLARDPGSGNLFFRTTKLRMNLLPVPEPATSLGLLAGAGMVAGLSRRRRSA